MGFCSKFPKLQVKPLIYYNQTTSNLLANSTGIDGTVLRTLAPLLEWTGQNFSAEKGAYTSVFAAANEDFKRDDSRAYSVPFGKIGGRSEVSEDMELARKLWQWTEEEMRGEGLL